jgi:hypothetical protein
MDPWGLLTGGMRFVTNAATKLPLADDVVKLLAGAERSFSPALREHVDADDPEPPALMSEAEEQQPLTPTRLLRSLLDRSMYTSPDDSRDVLYLDLLQALVPDEARIVAALSDATAYPVIHVAEPGVGNPVYVLQNASTIGRASGVSLPQHTPLYVSRLLGLGLAQLGPEVAGMSDEYEILLTDAAVRTALVTARRGVRAARVIRQTVRISDLGQELWEAAK